MFVLLDRPDAVKDKKLTEHILKLYNKSHKRMHSDIYQESDPDSTTNQLAHRAKRMQLEDREEEPFDDILRDIPLEDEEAKAGPASAKNEDVEFEESLAQRLEKKVESMEQVLTVDDMRKYVSYAREKICPRLTPEASEEMKSFYVKMREIESEKSVFTTNFPVTTRLLESLIRLAQARAKLELRDIVTRRDAREVIELVSECMMDFGAGLPSAGTAGSERKRRRKGIDMSNVGSLSRPKQTEAFVQKLRAEAEIRGDDVFEYNELVKIAKDIRMNVGDFAGYVSELNNASVLLLKGPQKYRLLSKSL